MVKVLRVGYRDYSQFEAVKPLLAQYFRLEPLPVNRLSQLLGVVEEPPRWPMIAGSILLLLLLGIPLRLYWPFGIASAIAFAYAYYRHGGRYSIIKSPVRFRASVASSDLLYSMYSNTDAYTYAMAIAQLPAWGIVVREDPILRGKLEHAYSSAREKAVVRVRGRYEVASARIKNAIDRLNTGERTYRIGIWLDADYNLGLVLAVIGLRSLGFQPSRGMLR